MVVCQANSSFVEIQLYNLEPYTDKLLEAVDYLAKKEAPVLLSVFATGDMNKLLRSEYPEDKLFILDNELEKPFGPDHK